MKLAKLRLSSILAAGLFLSEPVFAIPMAITGGIDLLLGSGEVSPSDPATEEIWVESLLGMDVTYTGDISSGFNWNLVDGEVDVFAHETLGDPEYFLVETSLGNLLGHTHFLFQNLFSSNYSVIDLSGMGFDPSQIDVSSVTGLVEFNGSVRFPVSVPEPGTLSLLGLGLVAFSLTRRRKSAA